MVIKILQNRLFILSLVFLTFSACKYHNDNDKIDISGEWKFMIDSLDIGIEQAWYNKNLQESVILPGSMNTNGLGNDVTAKTKWTGSQWNRIWYTGDQYVKFRDPDNTKIVFWLQPDHHYIGAAWYQKDINVPKGWNNKNIRIFLERCHWETTLWIDNQLVGMRNSLGTPHIYNLGNKISYGKHTITLRVDNRIKDINPGFDAHSITDNTQTNWNGIIGKMFVEALPQIYIDNIRLYPCINKGIVSVELEIVNPLSKKNIVNISLQANSDVQGKEENKLPVFSNTLEIKDSLTNITYEYNMGDNPLLWDEFNPNLYTMKVTLKNQESGLKEIKEAGFGMRDFKAEGTRFTINGKPVFIRGTLECAVFPETGYPSTSVDDWMRIFTICHNHGLNNMRFHSWTPPEAAFEAADKARFSPEVECGVWGVIGDGAPIDEFIYNESERIVKAYGNHPSFCMMAYGNEPWGENHTEYLKKFVTHWKNKDARRVYTSGAGWPAIPENDYHNLMEPRIQRWEEGINSVINKEKPETNYDWTDRISSYTKPVVSHEIGQWCVFPDLKEISEYNGVMKARNFEIFRETLENNGMLNLADSFLYASGKLQALCYKSDIEAALRTPGFAGFQLLDLHDFPGQGTALVGILNAFWEKKGYISSDQFKRFCNSSVPLARLDKRVYLNNEEFTARIEMAHFGESVLKDIAPEWKISNDKNEIIFSGKFKTTNIPLGNCFNIGTVTADLSSIIKPCKLTLQVFVDSYSNSWDIWVYPANNDVLNMQKSYRMVTTIDEETGKYLEDGGSVLLTLKKGTLKAEKGGNIVVGFSSIFWNTLWTNGQPPHTLGILCNPKHPIFEEFPTEQYSNWQWWDAMSHSNAIILSSVNPQPEPIVRVIDDWFTNRPLGLIFEAKVGKGKLLVSGIDLSGDLSERPEAGQMLLSISKYISGNHFNPEVEIPLEQVQSLYK